MIAKQPRITLQRKAIPRLCSVYTPSDNLAQSLERELSVRRNQASEAVITTTPGMPGGGSA
jgi:hypothetical protein